MLRRQRVGACRILSRRALFLLLVGGGLVAAPVVRAQEEVVRVADLLAISNAGVYLAIERGFFREQGIRNEVSTFASAAKVLPALASGEMEVAAGSPSAGFFNGVAQGATFRIVADKGQNRPGTGFTMLTVRRDLVESGRVKTVRDLKGRRVSLFAKGISQHYYAGRNLDDSPEETA